MSEEFLPEPRQIALGTSLFDVVPQPIARVKRFKVAWSHAFENFNRLEADFRDLRDTDETVDSDVMFDKIADFALEIPYELLEIAIPDLPKSLFEDEVNGVTFPQVYAAFDVILEVNDLEVLKKITPLFRDMILSIDPRRERMIASLRTASSPEQPSEQTSA